MTKVRTFTGRQFLLIALFNKLTRLQLKFKIKFRVI
jgi:hypothetical protein